MLVLLQDRGSVWETSPSWKRHARTLVNNHKGNCGIFLMCFRGNFIRGCLMARLNNSQVYKKVDFKLYSGPQILAAVMNQPKLVLALSPCSQKKRKSKIIIGVEMLSIFIQGGDRGVLYKCLQSLCERMEIMASLGICFPKRPVWLCHYALFRRCIETELDRCAFNITTGFNFHFLPLFLKSFSFSFMLLTNRFCFIVGVFYLYCKPPLSGSIKAPGKTG